MRFREGVVVNRKTVHRIMQLKGWHRPTRRPMPTWVTCSTVDQPDRLWSTDTMKIWCGQDA
jgi:hypothetical protein